MKMSPDACNFKCFPSPLSWSHKWKCEKTEENEQKVTTVCVLDGSFKKSISDPVEETFSTLPIQKPRIPSRFVFSFLSFVGLLNCYTMRVNLNVAMVAMVNSPTIPDNEDVDKLDVCVELIKKGPVVGNSTITIQQGEFDWDSRVQHLILASFYFFYMAFQIPLGIIAEKYYSKHFFGVGVLITAIFTLLTPVAAWHSVEALIAARAIQGLAQAASWPAMNALIGRWVPIMERSRMSAFIYNGSAVGLFFGFSMSGLLCDSTFLGGWPSVFYIFGSFGCLWYVFWIFLVFESPEDHPRITKVEIALIRKGQGKTSSKISIPWKAIVTSVPVWSLVVVQFGQDWAYHTLLTEMPIYLNNVLHFDIKDNGFLSALPNVISAATACFVSIFADKLREKGQLSITTIRKIFNSIGFYAPGLCILFMAFTGCSPIVIVILLCLTMGLNGFVFSGLFATHVDMSPRFAGTLMAITNSIGNIPGFLAPIYVGWIIKDGNTLHNWGIVFFTSTGFLIICGTIYNIFCSAELQKWGDSDDETDENIATTYNARWPGRKFSFPVN